MFDEHKESKLQKKLRELKEKRHAQRDRKSAKIKDAQEAALQKTISNTLSSDATDGAEDEKEESAYSAPDFYCFPERKKQV